MQSTSFDLNDIDHEPSDEQLDNLMQQVAEAARERAEQANLALKRRLREEIEAVNQQFPAA